MCVIESGVMIACQRVFQLSICFDIASHNVFVMPYNNSLNDWSLRKQLILLGTIHLVFIGADLP